ncbi:MAG: HPr family phosphocarrier protein [Pirellulales bacterium]|nr:HPr family phosphocarrier protein [Pirellulales bacterium]
MTPPAATRTFVVTNPQGLHARPADLLAKLAQQYPCRIEIIHGSERIDARSIINMLTLGAVEGTELRFEATGPDAEVALDAIGGLFASNFGE